MTQPVTVALAQLTGKPYAASDNRRRSVRCAEQAFADGADLVLLPEMIVPGYALDRQRLEGCAEELDGPTVAAWLEVARQNDGYLAGGFCERDGDRLYNSAVLVGEGRVLLHYRKLHRFAAEKQAFADGDLGLPVVETRLGRLGMCVCYDLRFVETLRILALEGAQLVCVPTAWVAGFDRPEAQPEAMPPQARGAILQANLNQVFVACASQVGQPGDFRLLGGSVVADPYGRCVAGPLSGEQEETVLVAVDLEHASDAQDRGGQINPRADRRTDVYRLAVGDRLL